MSSIRPNIDPKLYRINDTEMQGPVGSKTEETSLEQVRKEFDSFVPIDPNSQIHKNEMMEMFPLWLIEEAASNSIELFLQIGRYDTHYKTFVVGIFENGEPDSTLLSYKRRRMHKVKWHTRKGTHPNNIPFVRILGDESPVFFVEGHHDMLTAILLGIDFVMVPSAGFKLSGYPSLQDVIIDRDIIFLVEDEQAHKCMRALAEAFSTSARSIRLKTLGEGTSKLDLSDYVDLHKNSTEAKDGLQS